MLDYFICKNNLLTIIKTDELLLLLLIKKDEQKHIFKDFLLLH